MDSKRLVLTILLLTAGVAPLLAQQSAQATMKVQVTVVEGNSITMAPNKQVVLQANPDRSKAAELTTISIDKDANAVIVVNRPEKLNLQDEWGGSLEMPLIYSDRSSDKEMKSDLSLAPASEKIISKGSYKGSLTTTIAYL